MSGVEANVPEFAVHWATQLGASPISLKRLRGGINNRVFRCGQANHQWVIKGYGPVDPGQRDRMQAEVEFLQFAAHAAPSFTPRLIWVDPERRCVVLEHLEGEAFREGEPPSAVAIAEAVEFFRQLNAKTQFGRASITLDAAEGFLSLREHLSNVRARLESMTFEHLDEGHRPLAKTLLQELHLKLTQTEDHTIRLIDQ